MVGLASSSVGTSSATSASKLTGTDQVLLKQDENAGTSCVHNDPRIMYKIKSVMYITFFSVLWYVYITKIGQHLRLSQ